MVIRYAYHLRDPEEAQLLTLVQLHLDFAELCNDIAEVVRSRMDGDRLPTIEDVNLKVRGMDEFKEMVNVGDEGKEELVRRVPARYVALATNRVMSDLAKDPNVKYDEHSPVNLDGDLCTPKISAIDEPYATWLTIKCFGTPRGVRESLKNRCTKGVEDFDYLKAGQTVLVHDALEDWRVVTAVEYAVPQAGE